MRASRVGVRRLIAGEDRRAEPPPCDGADPACPRCSGGREPARVVEEGIAPVEIAGRETRRLAHG